MTFSLEEIKRFPSTSRTCFLECSGNFGRQSGERTTVQELCGLTSQSEWTGVRLSTLFKEVGARPQATWFLAEGQDAAMMTRSIPIKDVLDEAMIRMRRTVRHCVRSRAIRWLFTSRHRREREREVAPQNRLGRSAVHDP